MFKLYSIIKSFFAKTWGYFALVLGIFLYGFARGKQNIKNKQNKKTNSKIKKDLKKKSEIKKKVKDMSDEDLDNNI